VEGALGGWVERVAGEQDLGDELVGPGFVHPTTQQPEEFEPIV
jgi:hypothetical protein